MNRDMGHFDTGPGRKPNHRLPCSMPLSCHPSKPLISGKIFPTLCLHLFDLPVPLSTLTLTFYHFAINHFAFVLAVPLPFYDFAAMILPSAFARTSPSQSSQMKVNEGKSRQMKVNRAFCRKKYFENEPPIFLRTWPRNRLAQLPPRCYPAGLFYIDTRKDELNEIPGP